MFSLPLYVFLILSLIYFAVFIIFFIINVGHLFQTAALTMTSLIFTILIVATSILLVWAAWYLLSGTDWGTPVTIFDTSWLSGLFSFGSPF